MRPDKFYGFSEFLKSVEGIMWLDLDHLLSMISKFPLPTISMRLGWLLQKKHKDWYVEESHLDRLKAYRPEDKVFLISSVRNGNILDKTWNLMVPKEILNLDE